MLTIIKETQCHCLYLLPVVGVKVAVVDGTVVVKTSFVKSIKIIEKTAQFQINKMEKLLSWLSLQE